MRARLAALGRVLAEQFTTLLELAGIGLLVAFAGLVWWPAALAVAGVSLIVLAWAIERQRPTVRPVVDEVETA